VDAGARGGWLLLGHSGAGKSTLAGLIAEAGVGTILSDDRIVLRRQEERWWMFGTPWHGTAGYASARGCPLTRLFILSHGPKNRIAQLPFSVMAAEIAARTFYPLYAPSLMGRALQAIQRLVAEVPCHSLAFSPNPEVAWFLSSDNGASTLTPSAS
jgi:hypothetical protein